MRAVVVAAVLIAGAPLAALAQATRPADRPAPVNPDRNLEAARSYSPSPALDAIARETARPTATAPLGRVNGSASRDWTLHALG